VARHLIRALIFDFDGLILETEEPIYRSWKEVYEAHGVALPFELWVKTVGSSNQEFHPQRHLEESLGRVLTQNEIDRRLERRVELVAAESLRPGVADLARGARRRHEGGGGFELVAGLGDRPSRTSRHRRPL
jgi:putative hydrolase of the HAD superfamily